MLTVDPASEVPPSEQVRSQVVELKAALDHLDALRRLGMGGEDAVRLLGEVGGRDPQPT